MRKLHRRLSNWHLCYLLPKKNNSLTCGIQSFIILVSRLFCALPVANSEDRVSFNQAQINELVFMRIQYILKEKSLAIYFGDS